MMNFWWVLSLPCVYGFLQIPKMGIMCKKEGFSMFTRHSELFHLSLKFPTYHHLTTNRCNVSTLILSEVVSDIDEIPNRLIPSMTSEENNPNREKRQLLTVGVISLATAGLALFGLGNELTFRQETRDTFSKNLDKISKLSATQTHILAYLDEESSALIKLENSVNDLTESIKASKCQTDAHYDILSDYITLIHIATKLEEVLISLLHAELHPSLIGSKVVDELIFSRESLKDSLYTHDKSLVYLLSKVAVISFSPITRTLQFVLAIPVVKQRDISNRYHCSNIGFISDNVPMKIDIPVEVFEFTEKGVSTLIEYNPSICNKIGMFLLCNRNAIKAGGNECLLSLVKNSTNACDISHHISEPKVISYDGDYLLVRGFEGYTEMSSDPYGFPSQTTHRLNPVENSLIEVGEGRRVVIGNNLYERSSNLFKPKDIIEVQHLQIKGMLPLERGKIADLRRTVNNLKLESLRDWDTKNPLTLHIISVYSILGFCVTSIVCLIVIVSIARRNHINKKKRINRLMSELK